VVPYLSCYGQHAKGATRHAYRPCTGVALSVRALPQLTIPIAILILTLHSGVSAAGHFRISYLLIEHLPALTSLIYQPLCDTVALRSPLITGKRLNGNAAAYCAHMA